MTPNQTCRYIVSAVIWVIILDKKGVFPLSQPLIFPVEIEVRILCAATMGA